MTVRAEKSQIFCADILEVAVDVLDFDWDATCFGVLFRPTALSTSLTELRNKIASQKLGDISCRVKATFQELRAQCEVVFMVALDGAIFAL